MMARMRSRRRDESRLYGWGFVDVRTCEANNTMLEAPKKWW
jgi:hypothetical protein